MILLLWILRKMILSQLSGKIVVVSHRQQGRLLGRFRLVDGIQILESESRDYEPLVFGKDRNWKIMGKVLWLFRQTA
jgi:SOS-response transcriptional repressor LexA